MSPRAHRQTGRLHHGRVSDAGAVYFVTFVTADRRPWLATEHACGASLEVLRTWHFEGDGTVLAATVMPDHIHVLFQLGKRLPVGRCVSRWKAQTRRACGYLGAWQRDFWEHQVRPDDPWEDYGLYLFLNPYRAGLIPRSAAWPGWWIPEPRYFRFMALLGSKGEPPEEWIKWPEARFAGLAVGE
jgi:putative transposase